MNHIKKFESYRNGKKSEMKKESVMQVDDVYKVKINVDIPQSLINSYVKKVKDNTGKNLRQFMGDVDIAEEMVRYTTMHGLDLDKIPSNALVGGPMAQGQGQAQVQGQGQAQVQVQGQGQSQGQGQAQGQSQGQAQVQGQSQGQAQVQGQGQSQGQAQVQGQGQSQGQGQAQDENEEESQSQSESDEDFEEVKGSQNDEESEEEDLPL